MNKNKEQDMVLCVQNAGLDSPIFALFPTALPVCVRQHELQAMLLGNTLFGANLIRLFGQKTGC